MHTHQQQAIERAVSLPCWHDPQSAQLLSGGMTNHNVLLEDRGRRYVVRLGHDIPEHGIMRWSETAVSHAAHAAGLAPAVHFSSDGVLVLDFIDAAPMTEAEVRDPANLQGMAELVGKIHREVTPLLRGPVLCFWVFHVLRDYAQTLTSNASPYLPQLPELMEQAIQMEAMVGPVTMVLGHNDLLGSNILHAEDRFWLIDWEYAGMNSPLFDLGGIASNNGFSLDQEIRLLEAYFGVTPSAQLWRSYSAMKCASLLRETLWSMVSEITSDIDFDYPAYTTMNLVTYREAFLELQQL